MHSAELGYTEAADATVEQLKRLADSRPPTASPQLTQRLEQAMALVSQIAAATQDWADAFPPAGQRPPGTAEACADMAQEGRRAGEARFSEAQTLNFVKTFMDDIMDIESDEESEAPTEAGDEAKAAKKTKKAAKRDARHQRLKDRHAKVVATIGKH